MFPVMSHLTIKEQLLRFFAHKCMSFRLIYFENIYENKLLIFTDFKGTDIYDDCFVQITLKDFSMRFQYISDS